MWLLYWNSVSGFSSSQSSCLLLTKSQRYFSGYWLTISVWPSPCRWWAVVAASLILRSWYNSQVRSAMNWGPQSETTCLGMQLPHMCHVELGCSEGHDCSGSWNEVCLFAHWVYHIHDCIKVHGDGCWIIWVELMRVKWDSKSKNYPKDFSTSVKQTMYRCSYLSEGL